MTRVIFMGTPAFAVSSLLSLVERHHDVTLVVTQPDRRVGRGGAPGESAVKRAATAMGLAVFQPETLRSSEAIALLSHVDAEVIVVAAFGQILRQSVIDLPRFGCLNVHPSLLPQLRGASPIQSAIRRGDSATGVTIMLMNRGMDSGPILNQAPHLILPTDTADSLGKRLATLGAQLLVDTIPRWVAGDIEPMSQNDALASYCKPLAKSDAEVDWLKSASEIDRQLRANTPWPGCQSYWNGRQIRFLRLSVEATWQGADPSGTVVLLAAGNDDRSRFGVATGSGAVRVEELQIAGKRVMSATEFLRGQPAIVGARLGSQN